MLDIEFDPDKDAANVARHHIRLSAARDFDLDGALKEEDDRFGYGEVRMRAIGRLHRGIFVLIYTERNGRVRAISLRKANKNERERILGVGR